MIVRLSAFLVLFMALAPTVQGMLRHASDDLVAAIDDQQALVADRTKELRAAGCTNDYEFTYVASDSPVWFRNHLKRYTNDKKTICGWWFWTDEGSHFHLQCDFIDLRDEDYMVIEDMDNDQSHGMGGASSVTNHSAIFLSSNVVVGLETIKGREDRTFECKMSAGDSEAIMLGGRDEIINNNYLYGVSEVLGDIHVPAIPGSFLDMGMAMKDGVLYTCGGITANLDPAMGCYSLDVTDPAATYQLMAGTNQIGGVRLPIFPMEESLWVMVKSDIYNVPYTGEEAIMDSGVIDSDAQCGGGDANYRFIVGNDAVYYQNTSNSIGTWAASEDLTIPDLGESVSCFYFEEKFYITGGKDVATQLFSHKTYVVDANDLGVVPLPDMNVKVMQAAMGLFVGRVAVIGGVDEVAGGLSSAEAYDPDYQKWITIPDVLPKLRHSMSYLRTKFRL